MIPAQHFGCDLCFFTLVVIRADDRILPPFVAAGCAEHTAHQMPAAVRMGKSVQAVGGVHAKLFRGNKNGA